MMNWATLLLGFIAVVALVGVAFDEVRARIRNDGTPSPLSGMTKGDAVMTVLFFAPILIGFASAIQYVLT